MGRGCEEFTASRHQGCLNNVPFKTQSKEETGERRETMDGKRKEEGEMLKIGTISLICHASKIMLRVLTKRIEAETKQLLGRNQFEFRKGFGTRDAIGVMRTL